MSALPLPSIFASVFGVIFVAELPDKTALAALVLATRHKPLPVFLGAALALTLQSLIAVAAGGVLALFPERPVHIGAGLLFVVCAILMLRRKEEDEAEEHWHVKSPGSEGPGFGHALAKVFGVVFAAEWGDLTQLGTAALAARYHAPIVVFTAATLALWAVTAIAVFVGNRAAKLLDPHLTQRIAAVIFGLLGLALLIGVL
jgi:putative Ca2+/H+ antiporter (TMEM165/GDT1 family)